jgi:predicted transcriptional regulator
MGVENVQWNQNTNEKQNYSQRSEIHETKRKMHSDGLEKLRWHIKKLQKTHIVKSFEDSNKSPEVPILCKQ